MLPFFVFLLEPRKREIMSDDDNGFSDRKRKREAVSNDEVASATVDNSLAQQRFTSTDPASKEEYDVRYLFEKYRICEVKAELGIQRETSTHTVACRESGGTRHQLCCYCSVSFAGAVSEVFHCCAWMCPFSREGVAVVVPRQRWLDRWKRFGEMYSEEEIERNYLAWLPDTVMKDVLDLNVQSDIRQVRPCYSGSPDRLC